MSKQRLIDVNRVEDVFVGMGATEYSRADKIAYTVIGVADGVVYVQSDDVERVDLGGYGAIEQEYKYKPNYKGIVKSLIPIRRGWKSLEDNKRFDVGNRESYKEFSED